MHGPQGRSDRRWNDATVGAGTQKLPVTNVADPRERNPDLTVGTSLKTQKFFVPGGAEHRMFGWKSKQQSEPPNLHSNPTSHSVVTSLQNIRS